MATELSSFTVAGASFANDLTGIGRVVPGQGPTYISAGGASGVAPWFDHRALPAGAGKTEPEHPPAHIASVLHP